MADGINDIARRVYRLKLQAVVRGMALLVLAAAVWSCGDTRSAISPSAVMGPSSLGASTPPRAVSPVQSGYVMDSALRRLPGARVEIVDGPQAGTVLTTDAQGEFALSGSFLNTNTFRASKDGYVTATQGFSTSAPGGRPWLTFYLKPLATPVNVAGDYSLTLVADPSCVELPDPLRTRIYSATITPATGTSDTSFRLAVTGTPVLGTLNRVSIEVGGNTLGLWLDGGHDPTLVEQLGPNAYLAYSGLGWATVDRSASTTISGSFEGWIEYCEMNSPMREGYNCGTSNFTGNPIPGASITRIRCDASSHQLILTRR